MKLTNLLPADQLEAALMEEAMRSPFTLPTSSNSAMLTADPFLGTASEAAFQALSNANQE